MRVVDLEWVNMRAYNFSISGPNSPILFVQLQCDPAW